jgi:hypothetical protein
MNAMNSSTFVLLHPLASKSSSNSQYCKEKYLLQLKFMLSLFEHKVSRISNYPYNPLNNSSASHEPQPTVLRGQLSIDSGAIHAAIENINPSRNQHSSL